MFYLMMHSTHFYLSLQGIGNMANDHTDNESVVAGIKNSSTSPTAHQVDALPQVVGYLQNCSYVIFITIYFLKNIL